MKVDIYTHGHEQAVVESHRRRTAANSAAYLIPMLRPGLTVLDVGCESGTITKDFAALVAPGRVVGIDVDEQGINRGQEEYAQVPGLEFAVGSVYQLQFDDASFDVVHAHQVLQHLSDPVEALRQMARVTKLGGVVAARDVDYASMTWYPRVPELSQWLELYRTVAHANGAEPDAGPRLLSWAHAAGLTSVACSASTWVFTAGNALTWGESWARRCEESFFGRHAIERGLTTRADLDRIAAGWRRWSHDPDAWFGMIHGEILATKQ